jgi:hypothetical protein
VIQPAAALPENGWRAFSPLIEVVRIKPGFNQLQNTRIQGRAGSTRELQESCDRDFTGSCQKEKEAG